MISLTHSQHLIDRWAVFCKAVPEGSNFVCDNDICVRFTESTFPTLAAGQYSVTGSDVERTVLSQGGYFYPIFVRRQLP